MQTIDILMMSQVNFPTFFDNIIVQDNNGIFIFSFIQNGQFLKEEICVESQSFKKSKNDEITLTWNRINVCLPNNGSSKNKQIIKNS